MNREGLTLEYKKEYVEDIKKTIIAFGNTNGGKLYIGIDNELNITGIKNTDEILLKVTNSIRDSIKPDITLFTSSDIEIMDDKEIIVITVQKGTTSPYYLSNKGIRPEGVFVRHGASTVPATEAVILKMIKETSGENYEEVRSLNQNLTFLELTKSFEKASIILKKEQMKTLGIIGKDDLYSNLGLLLSDQCTHSIKLAIFQGTTKNIFKQRYEFTGALLTQLDETYHLIDIVNKKGAEFKGLYRRDLRDYPPEAIREALLNTIVHKDYSYSSSTLISVYDDRIEFITIGGLIKGMSKEDIMLGVSILRNKNLANIFYRLELIEAYGTGIPKIFESYEGYNPKPKIEITDNAFKITIYNTRYNNDKGNDKTTKIEKNKNDNVLEWEKKVLGIFEKYESIKRKDIEQELGISQPTAIKYLKILQEKDNIFKVGEGKNSIYRLK